jgi:hypothetical protein
MEIRMQKSSNHICKNKGFDETKYLRKQVCDTQKKRKIAHLYHICIKSMYTDHAVPVYVTTKLNLPPV